MFIYFGTTQDISDLDLKFTCRPIYVLHVYIFARFEFAPIDE
jgi:hypothetical protein